RRSADCGAGRGTNVAYPLRLGHGGRHRPLAGVHRADPEAAARRPVLFGGEGASSAGTARCANFTTAGAYSLRQAARSGEPIALARRAGIGPPWTSGGRVPRAGRADRPLSAVTAGRAGSRTVGCAAGKPVEGGRKGGGAVRVRSRAHWADIAMIALVLAI